MLWEQTRLLTIEEFVERFASEGPFEIVNGERIALMPNVALPSIMIRTLFLLLYNFCTAHHLGEVFFETTYILVEQSKWVKGSRVPDIMFISAERWIEYTQAMPDWRDKPLVLVPDLAVEVISPTDKYSEVQAKVEEYLQVGVRLVWVVDPFRQRVAVYQGQAITMLDKTATLTGSDVVPGFALALAELFAV